MTLFLLGTLTSVALILIASRFFGFRAQSPSDYAEDEQQLDLRYALSGPIACEGVIYGPLGRVASRFEGTFFAEWSGNRGRMTEHFIYDSGQTQDREWRLEIGNDGRIRAEADDLVGTGWGQQAGGAANLTYRIRLTKEAGGHVLDVTDWMYLAPNGAIVNRSQFRKFGIKVAELVATMRPADMA